MQYFYYNQGVTLKIAMVGAGWYGCHLALVLQKMGHDVTIFERNDDIFQGISGNFGIRLHSGSHYPRSPETRENCRRGYSEFIERYPEFVIDHSYSIYGLGVADSTNEASHVGPTIFKDVCEEFPSSHEIDPKKWGYQNLLSAHNMEEPSVLLGKPLRDKFKEYLSEAGVKLCCQTTIEKVASDGEQVCLIHAKGEEHFDKLINASSYQTLLPQEAPPFPFEVVYQPCLGLIYEDSEPLEKPFSFIVMDGLFPCVMPIIEEEPATSKRYLLTHGQYTILASCQKLESAQAILERIDDHCIESMIKPLCEQEINRFWPEFTERFQYQTWKGAILAKLKTKTEFRSAVTFEKDNIIHIIPGKISNIFDAERETIQLLAKHHIKTKNDYRYVESGVLDHGLIEIITLPEGNQRATTTLQTYIDLTR